MQRTGLFALAAVAAALAVAAPSAAAALASRGRVLTVADAPARDVAVIFGAQVHDDLRPSRYTAARLDLGVALFERGTAKVLLVSGDNRPERNYETSSMRRYLEARGVPASRIVEDPGGVDTYDTCVRARDVYGVTSALLVSQEYHLARAVATCRGVGVDGVGVADSSVKETRFWPYGAAREFPAKVKMAWDLATRRRPEFVNAVSSAVRDAVR